MILSAAIDSGYIFIALVAILTSVIGAGYYLNLVKQIFFFRNDYIINPKLENINLAVYNTQNTLQYTSYKSIQNSTKLSAGSNNVTVSSSLSSSISIITLLLLLFIFIPEQ
jgi:NADH-ubiquinone oxidoreductase chain 2